MPPQNIQPTLSNPLPESSNPPLVDSANPPTVQVAPQAAPVVNTPSQANLSQPPPAPKAKFKPHVSKRAIVVIVFIGLLFISSVASAYLFGKHGERIVITPPSSAPVTLPPQAIVVADCVPGYGKQYVLPKNIPNGPIYDVKDSRVIAVEYNYKAIDVLVNPDKLSNTIMPLTRKYQTDHFTTSIGAVSATASVQDQENIPVHVVIYMVSAAAAKGITCSAPTK